MAAQLSLVASDLDACDGVVKDPVLEVFEFWRVMMDKPRAQLGPKRMQKIRDALRIGYSVDDLRLAIVGCKYDNWSQGENDRHTVYDELELIVRDETKIDLYMGLGDKYMAKCQKKEREEVSKEKTEAARVEMPDYVRSKLNALFSRYRKS